MRFTPLSGAQAIDESTDRGDDACWSRIVQAGSGGAQNLGAHVRQDAVRLDRGEPDTDEVTGVGDDPDGPGRSAQGAGPGIAGFFEQPTGHHRTDQSGQRCG